MIVIMINRVFLFSILAAITCPSGFVKYRKSCFRFFEGSLTFDEAVDQCKQHDSQLSSIANIYEQGLIY